MLEFEIAGAIITKPHFSVTKSCFGLSKRQVQRINLAFFSSG